MKPGPGATGGLGGSGLHGKPRWRSVRDAVARLGAGLARVAPRRPQVRTVAIDEGVLARLRVAIGDHEARALLEDGMRAYAGYCASIARDIHDPAQVAAHAHKLKGSAGTLGLADLTREAAGIESAAREGRCEPGAARELQQVLVRTQARLREAGWL